MEKGLRGVLGIMGAIGGMGGRIRRGWLRFRRGFSWLSTSYVFELETRHLVFYDRTITRVQCAGGIAGEGAGCFSEVPAMRSASMWLLPGTKTMRHSPSMIRWVSRTSKTALATAWS